MSKIDKVDFVFPYVDGNDPIWQEVYKEERRKNDLPTRISNVRFRQWDNLKYLFRGIEKFAPWIGNVYMIVSNKEQVPEWVNTDEVNIVLHSDIIPEQFLPTFNSCTIEMFLGNIKGLSERFIYANDDMFFLRAAEEEDYFVNAVPKLSAKFDKGLDTMFKKVEWKCLKIAADHFKIKLPDPEEQFLKLPHTFFPMNKETVNVVHKLFKPEIYNSCSQFRKAKNFNQYLYTYYQIFSGSYLEGERTYKYTSFRDKEYTLDKAREIANDIIEQKYDSICINDVSEFKSEAVFDAIKGIINDAFEQILPDKSKYELRAKDINKKDLHIFKWLSKIGATFKFKNDNEIKMFTDGVIDLVEKIRNARTDDPSENPSTEPSNPSTEPSNPSTNPSNPSETTKDYAYYGYLNGKNGVFDDVAEDGVDISETSIKALNKVETTSKEAGFDFVATEAEEDAEGYSWITYAYPAKFGELSKYTTAGIPDKINEGFTKFDVTIDGNAYYVYIQNKGFAPDAGDPYPYSFA